MHRDYNREAGTWGWAKHMPKVDLVDDEVKKKRASAAQVGSVLHLSIHVHAKWKTMLG